MTSGFVRFGAPKTVVCNLGTSGTLAAHTPGAAYSGTFSVTNRVGDVTAELVSATPALPAGWTLAVNQATGVVTLAWPAAAPVSAPPLPNLDFETGTASWLLGNGWDVTAVGLVDSGTQSAKYNGPGQATIRHAQAVPVTPGTSITASARISKGANRQDFAGGAVVLEWLTAAGAPLSFSVGNVVNTGSSAFQTSTVTASAPAGAGLVRLGISGTRDIKGRAIDRVYADTVTWNHTYTLAGAPATDYAVVIRVRDGRGCQATLSQTITANNSTGTWIAFARPQGGGSADSYSIASAVPTSWDGAKRPTAVSSQGSTTINMSGFGGGNLYAAESGGPYVIRSGDLGASWTVTALDAVTRQQRIDVRNGRVIASRPSDFQYSDDAGVTRVVSPNRVMAARHFYGASSIVGGSFDVLFSTDNGTTRNPVGSTNFGRSIQLLIPGGTHLVAIGGAAGAANQFSRVPIGTPTIGHTPFTVAAVPATDTWTGSVAPCAAYGNGIFVAVTDQGRIARSTDEGASWTVSSFTFTNPRSLVFGDGVFVIVGAAGLIYSSTDGNTWTQINSGNFGTDNITNIIFVPN